MYHSTGNRLCYLYRTHVVLSRTRYQYVPAIVLFSKHVYTMNDFSVLQTNGC